MRKLTIAVIAALACGCKTAPTVNPKALSPDFAKAAVKALITARQPGSDEITRGKVRAAMIDAETASSNANDKAAFALIKKFQFLRDVNGASFIMRTSARELALIDRYLDSRLVSLEEQSSPATKREEQSEKICSDDIEQMLRSGVFAEVHSCEPRAGQVEEIKRSLQKTPEGRAVLQTLRTPL